MRKHSTKYSLLAVLVIVALCSGFSSFLSNRSKLSLTALNVHGVDLSWTYDEVVEKFGPPDCIDGDVHTWGFGYLAIRRGIDGHLVSVCGGSLAQGESVLLDSNSGFFVWRKLLGAYSGARVESPTIGLCAFSAPETRWVYHYPNLSLGVLTTQHGYFFRAPPKFEAIALCRTPETFNAFGVLSPEQP